MNEKNYPEPNEHLTNFETQDTDIQKSLDESFLNQARIRFEIAMEDAETMSLVTDTDSDFINWVNGNDSKLSLNFIKLQEISKKQNMNLQLFMERLPESKDIFLMYVNNDIINQNNSLTSEVCINKLAEKMSETSKKKAIEPILENLPPLKQQNEDNKRFTDSFFATKPSGSHAEKIEPKHKKTRFV